ncbi:hypothetical protein TNCV_2573981 [Trichonephila clavipes]|nr:hypothetical protein TNCV_2573981 [Trichonephila clavipes]
MLLPKHLWQINSENITNCLDQVWCGGPSLARDDLAICHSLNQTSLLDGQCYRLSWMSREALGLFERHQNGRKETHSSDGSSLGRRMALFNVYNSKIVCYIAVCMANLLSPIEHVYKDNTK